MVLLVQAAAGVVVGCFAVVFGEAVVLAEVTFGFLLVLAVVE